MVIEIAESPRRFAAVTVTCESATPLFGDEALEATGADASATPLQATISHPRASDFLTAEYYQP